MPMLLDSEALNDYIRPANTAVHLDESTNTYYEVTKEGSVSNLNETNAITLSDCLACAGCITSAELVMVQQQSHAQFLSYLESRREAMRNKVPVPDIILSISRESLAALAARYDSSLISVARKITWFAKKWLDCARVLDLAVFNRMALQEVGEEFKTRLQQHNEKMAESTSTAASPYHDHSPLKTMVSTTPLSSAMPVTMSTASFSSKGPSSLVPRRRINPNMLKHRDFSNHSLPLLCSACPGWICYVEKEHTELVPLLSRVCSPQQLSGAAVKKLWPGCYYVTVMPCPDKKLEAVRPDFVDPETKVRQVDSVLTTLDLENLLAQLEPELSFADFPETEPLDPFFECTATHLSASPNSTSGGYVSHIVMNAPSILQLPEADLQLEVDGHPDFVEYIIRYKGQPVLWLAGVYGFKQIQNYLRRLANDRVFYHYVEIMACPRGCANGGGQGPMGAQYTSSSDWVGAIETEYFQYAIAQDQPQSTAHHPPDPTLPLHDETTVQKLYEQVVGGPPGSETALKLFRTCFHPLVPSGPSYLLQEKNPISNTVKRVLTVQDALW